MRTHNVTDEKSHGGTYGELKGDTEGTRNSWGTHGVGCQQGNVRLRNRQTHWERTRKTSKRHRIAKGNEKQMWLKWDTVRANARGNSQTRSIWLGEHRSIHLTEESLTHEKHKNITKLINAVYPELVISFMAYAFHVVNVSSIWCIPGKRKSIQ